MYKVLAKIHEENGTVNITSLGYHSKCSLNYFAKYQRKLKPPPINDLAMKRDSYKIAIERFIKYIKKLLEIDE